MSRAVFIISGNYEYHDIQMYRSALIYSVIMMCALHFFLTVVYKFIILINVINVNIKIRKIIKNL